MNPNRQTDIFFINIGNLPCKMAGHLGHPALPRQVPFHVIVPMLKSFPAFTFADSGCPTHGFYKPRRVFWLGYIWDIGYFQGGMEFSRKFWGGFLNIGWTPADISLVLRTVIKQHIKWSLGSLKHQHYPPFFLSPRPWWCDCGAEANCVPWANKGRLLWLVPWVTRNIIPSMFV